MKNNPYVGPRPYERQDRHNFYGREREARELRALIVAEREVLFYAQSGAGKTSLLNARVIPALEDKRFHVLPVGRVGNELPPGVGAGEVDNVFVFSALLTLAGEEADPQMLLDHTLPSFLESRLPQPEVGRRSRPLVLILDQFEEMFTTHRERWREAEGFFMQMREALDSLPGLGVVFAMREDHVAALDPYITLFPRRLRARFRMERLGPEGALAAVTRPAESAGCPFASGVAERLVDDLRRIKVQRYAGGREETTVEGPYVEPVQLQVVCSQLWANLPEQEDNLIQWEEVQQHGNIDRALTAFYESALDEALWVSKDVTGLPVGERQLRRWFGEQLITPMGTRGLVLRALEETAGLPNGAVDVLEGRHIIRADVRAGARWYELSHDRLIEPILTANQAWRDKHQNPLALAARSWVESDKDPTRLLKGDALEEAKAQVRADPGELTEVEKEFVAVSLETASLEAARRQRLVLLGAVSLLAVFVILTAWALFSAREAATARDEAEIASTLAVANAGTASAERATALSERNDAVAARAALADKLEADLLTAQAPGGAEATPIQPTLVPATATANQPTSAAATATQTRSLTVSPEASPTNLPTATRPSPTLTPDLSATAAIEALQQQLADLRTTQTVAAQDAPPFAEGIVISFGGATGDYLLRDPFDEQSGILWVDVGTEVTLLRRGEGSLSYGSGEWYLVSLVDPNADRVWEGWLPAEVIAAR